MPGLPDSNKLPIHHLSTCFNNVTNSYKFYWFLSVLEYVKENQTPVIPFNHLLANMAAGVWYPTNYFRLSFGKQDRLSQIALKLKTENNLSIDAKKTEV
ncbi:MAG: HNH endonuclease, partial [Deltaproteobacteria bacterium]|nr:HNH endonuclease [Deltaproteobacteria bacterium]